MYTNKIRTYLDIPVELFQDFLNSFGEKECHRMINFEQLGNELLDFKVAEIPINRAVNKPFIGIHRNEERAIFAFWYSKKEEESNPSKNAQFILVAKSVPLTEDQIVSGEKTRFDIKFQTSPEGIDPFHLSSEIASDVLKKAHQMLKNTKNYRRVLK